MTNELLSYTVVIWQWMAYIYILYGSEKYKVVSVKTQEYAFKELAAILPPPESFVISSSRCGMGLSSSYSIHLPRTNKRSQWVKSLNSSMLTKYKLFQKANHFLAWPRQHNARSQHCDPCVSAQQPNHKLRSSVVPSQVEHLQLYDSQTMQQFKPDM